MVPETVHISDDLFSLELVVAVESLKYGKAMDGSGISAEMLKLPVFHDVLLKMINE